MMNLILNSIQRQANWITTLCLEANGRHIVKHTLSALPVEISHRVLILLGNKRYEQIAALVSILSTSITLVPNSDIKTLKLGMKMWLRCVTLKIFLLLSTDVQQVVNQIMLEHRQQE